VSILLGRSTRKLRSLLGKSFDLLQPCWCWASGKSGVRRIRKVSSGQISRRTPISGIKRRMRFHLRDDRHSTAATSFDGHYKPESPGTAGQLGASGRGSSLSRLWAHSKTTNATSTAICIACRLTGPAGLAQSFLPHLPVQGLIFRAKKSLASANSPILAWRSVTCSSSTSGVFRQQRSNTPNTSSSKARFH